MITGVFDTYLVQILEKVLFGAVVCYFLFSIVVFRQTKLLTSSVKTNLSHLISAVVLANLLLGFLGVVAAASLVF